MKQLLLVIALVGLSAGITYLVVTRNMAEERAARLNGALMQAEEKSLQLESDLSELQAKLAQEDKWRRLRNGVLGVQNQTSPASDQVTTGAGAVENASPVETSMKTSAEPVNDREASATYIRFVAVPGGTTNLVRLEGTSSIHEWQVQSRLIGGSVEMEPLFGRVFSEEDFQGRPIRAKLSCFVPVRSMASVNADGSPYSSAMDEIMYRNLKVDGYNRLTYVLTSLELKGRSSEKPGSFVCEALGQLAVAGRTNETRLNVTISPINERRLQFTGDTRLKMTDFGITPPAPSIAGGAIKTGDEVVLRFAWTVERR